MNMYVGNHSFETTEAQLQQAFEAQGQVSSAKIISDKFTGRSRGFGFVEMPDNAAAKAAMQALDGTEMNGRNITVNEARPKPEGGGRRTGGGGGGFGGGGGGGGRRSSW